MNKQDKEARALRRQIRYVIRTCSGRLSLAESRPELLRAVGRFLDQVKFGSHGEAAQVLGIKVSQLRHLVSSYRQQVGAEGVGRHRRRKLRLARVKIIDESARGSRFESGPVEVVLESGVRVSVGSTDAVIDLLERLEQRGRLKAAS